MNYILTAIKDIYVLIADTLTAIDYVVSNRPQKNGNTPQINTTKCFHEVAIWVILITKIYFGGFFVHERKKKQSKVCQTHTEA